MFKSFIDFFTNICGDDAKHSESEKLAKNPKIKAHKIIETKPKQELYTFDTLNKDKLIELIINNSTNTKLLNALFIYSFDKEKLEVFKFLLTNYSKVISSKNKNFSLRRAIALKAKPLLRIMSEVKTTQEIHFHCNAEDLLYVEKIYDADDVEAKKHIKNIVGKEYFEKIVEKISPRKNPPDYYLPPYKSPSHKQDSLPTVSFFYSVNHRSTSTEPAHRLTKDILTLHNDGGTKYTTSSNPVL